MYEFRRKKLVAGLKRPKALLNAVLLNNLKIKPINNPFSPWRIQIEPTSKCNLHCLSCSRSTYSKDMIGDMNLNDFKYIINTIPNLLYAKIQGMGEPFFNKEIVNMLKYCKKKNIVTEIITNGTIFVEESLNYLDRLGFSFDGGTKETFELLRPGANFENVINNIKKAVKLREKTIIMMVVTVSNNNINELTEIVDLAWSLKVNSIHFGLVEQWIVDQNEKRKEVFNLIPKNYRQKIVKAVKYAEEFGLQTSFNLNRDWAKTCLWPWHGLFITYDGFITPCCIRPDKRVINFGNVLKESFHEIWNNKKYQQFRISLKENKPTNICKNCPS